MQPVVVLLAILGSISWFADVRDVVSFLRPDPERRQLEKQALIQLTLACHWWKNDYMGSYPASIGQPGHYRDIWEQLEKGPTPAFSPAAWMRYKLLFVERVTTLRERLDEVLLAHGDIISHDLRRRIEGAKLMIQLHQETYLGLPRMEFPPLTRDEVFEQCFRGMVRTLAALDAEVQRLLEQT